MTTLFTSFGAHATSSDNKSEADKAIALQTVCSKTTDEDLVSAIRESLAADAAIKDQMSHLNVSVKKRVVTLEGWLSGNGTVAKAVSIVKKTKCVRRVVNRLKTKGGGSCGPGQKPCGDICIRKDSECTIIVNNQ